jgi:hypothetical protein
MDLNERLERIRTRAYELWEQDGRPEGREWSHWLDAERDVDAEQNSELQTESMTDGTTGITNHPVEEERQEQRELPPRGQAKDETDRRA